MSKQRWMKEWVWHDPCLGLGYAELPYDAASTFLPQPKM
jgi:hypothetical protein